MRANYKKTAIILGLSVILIGGGGTIFAKKINNNVSINAQAQENKKEEEKIVVIRQFRVPINSYIYEMPAGLIDKGENPLISLTRELKEETGLDVIEILENTVKGQLFLSPGMTDESVTSAFCTCRGTISKGYMEEDEDIEPILLSQKEVQELLTKDVKFDIKCYIYLQQFSILGKKMFQ